MGWIQGLFSGSKEKESVNRLAIIADVQRALDPEEMRILMQEMNYTPTANTTVSDLEKYRVKLPQSAKEKFSVVFYLVETLMQNGALSEKKESLIRKLIVSMELSNEKALELISFLKMNIRNGLSEEDSFTRLGYLLERAKYA
ncbi:MAG: hypothetical protein RJQ14_26265 [Marinoscillum sp.]